MDFINTFYILLLAITLIIVTLIFYTNKGIKMYVQTVAKTKNVNLVKLFDGKVYGKYIKNVYLFKCVNINNEVFYVIYIRPIYGFNFYFHNFRFIDKKLIENEKGLIKDNLSLLSLVKK